MLLSITKNKIVIKITCLNSRNRVERKPIRVQASWTEWTTDNSGLSGNPRNRENLFKKRRRFEFVVVKYVDYSLKGHYTSSGQSRERSSEKVIMYLPSALNSRHLLKRTSDVRLGNLRVPKRDSDMFICNAHHSSAVGSSSVTFMLFTVI